MANLNAALQLARRGLHVFPCHPRTKYPATPHGFKDATIDRDVIEHWWHREPEYNVAIATGKLSGIFIVDIDGAEHALAQLEAKHGALPATVEVITAHGRHIYFKMPDVPVRSSAGKIASDIDVRGDGGYVLAPPSVHPSGRRYAWSVDSAGAFAAAPDWLLDKITVRANGNGSTAIPLTAWRDLTANIAAQGTRDDTVTRLAGHLLRHRVDPIVTHTLLQSWNSTHCKPPLPEADILKIVNSICGKELRRLGHD